MNWREIAKRLGDCSTIGEVQKELQRYEAVEYRKKEEKLAKLVGYADQLIEIAERGPATPGSLCREAARKIEGSKLAMIGVALIGNALLSRLIGRH